MPRSLLIVYFSTGIYTPYQWEMRFTGFLRYFIKGTAAETTVPTMVSKMDNDFKTLPVHPIIVSIL